MMVDGCHLEQPLAMGGLKIRNLQNHGQCLANIHKAHQNQHQGHIQGKGHGAHHAAHKERAGIAHKQLCRMPVQAQIGQQSTNHGSGHQGQIIALHGKAGGGEEYHHRDGDRAAQAVDAVGQVHGIVAAHHDEHGKHDVHRQGQIQRHIHKGNVQVAGQASGAIEHIHEDGRYSHLEHSLLNGGQPQIPLVFDLAEIIQKAHNAKGERQQPHIKRGVIRHPGQISQQAQQG